MPFTSRFLEGPKNKKQRIKMKKILTIIGLAAATLAGAQAQILTFNFTGTNPGQNTPWTTTSSIDTNLNLNSGWTLNGGLVGNSGNNRLNGNTWSTSASYSASGPYFSFTIQAASGFQVNLSGGTITFTLQNSGTGPDFYSIRSSVDSYAADLSASSTALTAAGGTTATSLTLPSVPLTWNSITSSVTFRVYGWGASSTSGTMSVNAFSLGSGTSVTAVPEPQTWALIGIGSAFMIWNLRRRRVQS